MKRAMSTGRHATSAAHAESTMFFSSVSPLVSFSASPKQPQSFTGSATNIHSVSTVIAVIKASVMRDTTCRRTANSMNTPNANSNAPKAIATPTSAQSGSNPFSDIAAA